MKGVSYPVSPYRSERNGEYSRKFIEWLEKTAIDVRMDDIRMINHADSGHPGSSLSCVEIALALQFHPRLNHYPSDPNNKRRDVIGLSKGHACTTLYGVRLKAGYYHDLSEDDIIVQYRKIGSIFQGHPHQPSQPGIVEIPSGSLGQGLSVINGLALAARMDKDYNRTFFCIMGDGEQQEGQVWEAAMTGAHYKLPVCAVIDYNEIQIDGHVKDIKNIEPLDRKWESFGWKVRETDGHDIEQLLDSIDWALDSEKPNCIIARTVKGKGVSYMEGNKEWHGKAPKGDKFRIAIEELERQKGLYSHE